MPRTSGLFLLLVFLLASAGAAASDRALARLPSGAAVTSEELKAEALSLPPQVQEQVFARPADTAQFAQAVLLRRELARQAEADGLLTDPKVAAALRAARERVLADAALARIDAAGPDRSALERQARNQYDAEPEKFASPEQVRVSHVLVSSKACEPEARAREVLARARQPGADFAQLAREYSDDSGSAARGGDVGFFPRGRMAAPFEAAAFSLKQPGDLSDVVKTEFGYHIIRLEERKPAARQAFEAVREPLVKNLADSEARSRRQQLVDRLTAGIQFDQGAIEALVAGRPLAARKGK
jgi:peptidyl-prolyl cis-trans isomerase C